MGSRKKPGQLKIGNASELKGEKVFYAGSRNRRENDTDFHRFLTPGGL